MQIVRGIELTVALILVVMFWRPRRKPPVHPVPVNDTVLLRRIRIGRLE